MASTAQTKRFRTAYELQILTDDGRWLIEWVSPDRKEILEEAKRLAVRSSYSGVRVVKEYSDTVKGIASLSVIFHRENSFKPLQKAVSAVPSADDGLLSIIREAGGMLHESDKDAASGQKRIAGFIEPDSLTGSIRSVPGYFFGCFSRYFRFSTRNPVKGQKTTAQAAPARSSVSVTRKTTGGQVVPSGARRKRPIRTGAL